VTTGAKFIAAFSLAIALLVVAPGEISAQKNCGAEGQRPCKLWERIPSCDKGLREDFRLSMCVGPRTQVDAKSGKYIPRKKEAKMTWAVLCNRSSRPMIDVAIAQYVNPEYGWVTNGWIRVPSGRCEKADIDYDYVGAIYVYGKAQDGTVWDNSESEFCIKPYEAFEVPNADSLRCPTRDFAIVRMVKYDVKTGNNTITFAN
jgi:uncharacterized membrane protein